MNKKINLPEFLISDNSEMHPLGKQSAYQLGCQTQCEISCESPCQDRCQSSQSCGSRQSCDFCENIKQGCGICQMNCQDGCKSGCQVKCQTGCQVSSQQDPIKNRPPQMPANTYLTATSKKATSLELSLKAIPNADYYILYYKKNGESTDQSEITQSTTVTILGLASKTSYTLYYVACNQYGTSGKSKSSVATTAAPDISPWKWSFTVSEGRDFLLTAKEWQNFCNKINEVRRAYGMNKYDFTTSDTYISTGKPFYAWIFLQAANAIHEIFGSNGSNSQVASACILVASGDSISAWYFTNLQEALNNLIQYK